MKKKTLLSIALGLLLGVVHAQEAWRDLFATDPMASNGCFILNPEKAASLRIATVEVKIVADKANLFSWPTSYKISRSQRYQ